MVGKDVDSVLRSLDSQHGKFKFMESSMMQRRAQLKSKLPEIEKALQSVEQLIAHKDDEEPMETRFELSDTLFATAKVSKPKSVCLWLGVRHRALLLGLYGYSLCILSHPHRAL